MRQKKTTAATGRKGAPKPVGPAATCERTMAVAGPPVLLAEVFSGDRIVHARSAQLSWTHLRRIIYLDDPLKREFGSMGGILLWVSAWWFVAIVAERC